MKHLLLCSLIFTFSSLGFKKTDYKLGEKVQDFSLTNALDNTPVSLTNLLESKGVVIIFVSRGCPYSKVYENRIGTLAKSFAAENVKFVLISTGPEKASSLSDWASEMSWTSPILMDPRKDVARKFGASKTPEAFVLKNMNNNFYIKYKGAIDDNPQTEKDVRNTFLRDAISAVISDGPIKIQEKRATGCMIR